MKEGLKAFGIMTSGADKIDGIIQTIAS